MKKQTGIWIDTSKAILVTLMGGEDSIIEIESDIENRIYHRREGSKGAFIGNQHLNKERRFDERRKSQIDEFIDLILEQIETHDEIYIMGPAEIKIKLKQAFGNDNKLSQKLKSVETADSMTLNQLIAKVKEFYNKQK